MSRAEADDLLSQYDDANAEYRIVLRYERHPESSAKVLLAFARMNNARERVLDALCGEESTQEMPGRVL